MSLSDSELRDLAVTASTALQEIQDSLGRGQREAGKVQFPRRYLVEVGRWRLRLAFVRQAAVRNNVAYTLMLHDVHTWLLRRTDLAGLARDMLIKACLAALGSIAEALVVDFTSPPMGRRQRFRSRAERLVADGVITQTLADDLCWLWEMRNRQHLQELAVAEFDFYRADDHTRADRTIAALITSLETADKIRVA